MPNLRIEGSANHFHRPDDDASGAWLTAAVAIAITVGVISLFPERSNEPGVTHHSTVMNMPQLMNTAP